MITQARLSFDPQEVLVARMLSVAFEEFAAALRSDRCSDDRGCSCGCRDVKSN